MAMAWFYSYPDVDPYPTTYVAQTFPEKGHRLHHLPIPYLAHKAHSLVHDKDLDIHLPKSDLRETPKNFYLEIELPGVRDKSELHLRWTTMRTLLITTKTARPEIPESELADVPAVPTAEAPAEKKEGETATPPTVKQQPHLTLHERGIGELMRAFNFPVDVDRDNTHAKLDAGLLTVVIPKVEHEEAQKMHIPVKVQDAQ